MPACIGILALQGAFREHRIMLDQLGVQTKEVRQVKHLEGIDALIIPGGESTTISKLLQDLAIFQTLQERIDKGLPVYGSCAGLIMLCQELENSHVRTLAVLKAKARRNAFGRQVDSFETPLIIKGLDRPLNAVFIRAPAIIQTAPEVEILATISKANPLDNDAKSTEIIVAVRQKNILATAFHPELTSDTRMHQMFLEML